MDNSSNMLQLCRLCLVKDDVNIPIFEEQGDIRQIFLKISSCLPVKVSQDDRLPKKICDGCSYKLDMLYEFWNSSANAEKQLLTWLGEAGMTSQMTDGTISAVAQQIKPADALVKQETIDPPDINHSDDDEDDDKTYMFNKQEEKVSKNNIDEPPPKRQRRTAAVKAAIAMDQNSDDDDDSGEPMTKMEDDSDDSDNDDHEPAFVDVPSTSADDQPGPSGMGKDGVDAPSYAKGLQSNINKISKCFVQLVDLKYDKSFNYHNEFLTLETKLPDVTNLYDRKKILTCYVCMAKFSSIDALSDHKRIHEDNKGDNEEDNIDRKKHHTCYVCMIKFSSLETLEEHKQVHASDCEDDLFEEDYEPKNTRKTDEDENLIESKDNKDNKSQSRRKSYEEENVIEKKVNNLNVLQKNIEEPKKTKRGRKSRVDTITVATDNDKSKENVAKIDKSKENIAKIDKSKENVANSDKTKENIKTPFKCDTCNVFFQTAEEAKTHITSNKCKFSCHLCNRKFNTLYAFIVHVMQHRSNAVKNQNIQKSLYTCNFCDKHFADCFQLKRHEFSVHKNKLNPNPFTTNTEVVTTEVFLQTDTDNTLTCDLCYDIFNTKEELDSHTDFHKQIEETETQIHSIPNTTVEIIEDTRDKHDIITTIQTKQNLTEKIKDIISSNTTKHKPSKTIFLPNIVEEQSKAKGKKILKLLPKTTTLTATTTTATENSNKIVLSPSSNSKGKITKNVLLPKPTTEATTIEDTNKTILPPNHKPLGSIKDTNKTILPPNHKPLGSIKVKTLSSLNQPLVLNNIIARSLVMNNSSSPFSETSTSQNFGYIVSPSTNEIKDEKVTMPKIESVVSLNQTSDNSNQDCIVIDDSDSEETNINNTTDNNSYSDEENNLVIDLPTTSDDIDLEKPLESSNTESSYRCHLCDIKFNDYSLLVQHVKEMDNCSFCCFVTCQRLVLKNHYIDHHKMFLCEKCKFVCNSYKKLAEHCSTNPNCRQN